MSANNSDSTPDDAPQYPGDDTRPTSRKEIAGWLSYGFAAEPFVICGVGSFIPIALEQLSRDKGSLLSDRRKPCKGSSFEGVPPPPSGSVAGNLTALLLPRVSKAGEGQCIIRFLGADINTASFAMYTFSISVFIQALLIISMSAAADHGKSRKSFLLSFALTGALSTSLFLFVVPDVYALGALLAIVANTCFGASFVLLNSFLPIIVRRHPSLKLKESATTDARPAPDHLIPDEPISINDLDEVTDALLSTSEYPLPAEATNREGFSPALRLSTKFSSYGIGIGYLAAVFVQSLGILLVVLIQPRVTSTTLPLRVVLCFVGLWWLGFTVPAALWLRPRPGPPLPTHGKGQQTWSGYIAYAWKSLGKTIIRARRLKDMLLFLAVWFLLSDSIATISGTAVLFAKTELEMKPAALAMISLIGTVVGVVGAFSWGHLSRFFKLKPAQTIIACICLFEVIPLYGLLGFIPAVQRLGRFGLQQPWEMYPLGAVYGFVLGGLSSYCRSLFGELIPPGSEAAFYALYAITDKGSSIFGPAVVGAITDRYGEIRPAFVFLAVIIFVPLPLMLLVDVDRGRKEAADLARVLEGRTGDDPMYSEDDGQ